MDLINNNISRDVQEMCIAAMMEYTGCLTPCPNYTRQNQSYITANQKTVWAEPPLKRTALATANQKTVWAEPPLKRTALATANQKSVWADAHCSRNEIIMFII